MLYYVEAVSKRKDVKSETMSDRTSVLNYFSRRWANISGEFRLLWKNYLYQSLLAAVVLAIVLVALSLEHAVVIASIGATAFIVFTMPGNVTARPRNVIGGHLVGLACGSLAALIPHHVLFSSIIVYVLAVGVAIFLMVALGFEHPPAGGTALGVAITGFSVSVMIAIVTASAIMSLAHRFCRRHLRDLT